eukprot:11003953-Karenia_brevis.AAC.1
MERHRQEDDREQAPANTGQYQAFAPSSTPAAPGAQLWRSASAILRGPPRGPKTKNPRPPKTGP